MTDYLEKKLNIDGCSFQVRIEGEGDFLLLLHGFTGSIGSMASLASTLSGKFRVISIDLPGHGRTYVPKYSECYGFSECNTAIARILDQLHIDQCFICGYSMGGRMALLFAVQFPSRVTALATIGASGGIEGEEERTRRREKDEKLALFLESEGIEAFTERWMAQPLFASQQKLGKFFHSEIRRQKLSNNPSALALSLRNMGTGSQAPVYLSLQHLGVPMLFIAGEEDKKFCDLANKLRDSCPLSHIHLIKYAGHAAHLENELMTARSITEFFQSYPGTVSNG